MAAALGSAMRENAVKILSWNIQRGRGKDGRCSIGKFVENMQAIADADVYCLQEVSSGHTDLAGCDGANLFDQLAQQLPGFTPVAAVASDTLGEGGTRRLFGCMILSRLPVLQAFRHTLPWPADPAVMSMQRVALEVTLDTPVGPLRVSTTHLEYFSQLQRSAQVQRLRELHGEASCHAHQPRPGEANAGPFAATPRAARAILTGDFNFAPRSADYQRLQSRFHDQTRPYLDAWRLVHAGQPHAPTVCLHDKPERRADPFTSDFIFVTDDLSEQVRRFDVVSEDLGPDHQPLVLQID